jgi:hypothetical protein
LNNAVGNVAFSIVAFSIVGGNDVGNVAFSIVGGTKKPNLLKKISKV